MEFKLFSDFIDALEKVAKGISTLRNIPRNEREHYREIINDTCTILDTAILLVVSRLGDILMIDEIGNFAKELRALDNFNDWLKLERDVRLCNNLRVASREMINLWNKAANQLALQDATEFMRFMQDIKNGERELANYISMALARLAQLGKEVDLSPMSVDNARITVRGVKNALLKERQRLIAIQIKLSDEII